MRPLVLVLLALLTWAPALAADEAAYAGSIASIESWSKAYPDLVSVHDLGHSHEGRPIRALRISATPPSAKPPALLFASGIHGHEGSQDVALVVVRGLLARAKTPPIRRLLETRALWVVLLSNPDGVFHSRRQNAKAVDLNRNFGHHWGQGWGLAGPQARVFPGSGAFSEPETRALRDFLKAKRNVTLYVDCHRSARLILLPYGARKPSTSPPALVDLWEGLNAAMDGFHKPLRRRRIRDWLPQGSGYAVDWAHAELGVGALVWECPYGPIPQADAEIYLKGTLFLLGEASRWKRKPVWF